MAEAELKTVKSMLRAVLMSCKEGVPAHVLQKDYREMTGEFLPFKKMGFSNLEDFIRSVPDVVSVRLTKGEVTYHAVADSSNIHLQKLISKQRSRKPRKLTASRKPRPNYRPRFPQAGFPPGKPRYPPRLLKTGYQQKFSLTPIKIDTSRDPNVPRTVHRATDMQTEGTRWQPIVIDSASNTPSKDRAAPEGSEGLSNLTVVVGNREGRGRGRGRRSVQVMEGPGRILNMAVADATTDSSRKKEGQKYPSTYEVPPRFKKLHLEASQQAQYQDRPPPPAHQPPHLPLPTPQTPAQAPKPVITTKPVPKGPKDNFPVVKDGEKYMQRFFFYCKERNLMPLEFNTMAHKVLNMEGYISSIELEGKTFGSEDVFRTQEEAEQAVAKNAVENLHIQEDGTAVNYASTTSDTGMSEAELQQVREHVKEILSTKKNGLWGTRFPFEYKEKYGEPPGNLLSLMKEWKDIVRVEFVPNTERDIFYPVLEDPNKDRLLKIPQEELLPVNDKVVVYLTYLKNCGYFCVQKEDSVVSEIAELLQAECKEKKSPGERMLAKEQFCAGLYAGDNSWTRAEIIDISHHPTMCELLYVDYGDVGKVSPDNIRWLSEKSAKYPAQAVTCSLFGITPLEDESEEWSAKSSEVFAELVEDQALYAVTHTQYDNICDVELYLMDDTETSINQMLVNKGLVQNCLLEDVLLEEDEADVEEEDSVEPGPIRLPSGNIWDVYVTFIKNSTKSIMLRLVGGDYSDKLDSIESSLEEAFKNSSSEMPLVEDAVYVAYDDGLYHRVRLLATEGKKVLCCFLDHGDTDRLLPEQLEPLDPKVNKMLPYQAIEVCMHGLDDVCTNITALEKVCDLAIGKTCVAEIVVRSDCPSVILYDTSGDEDVNINEAVLQAIDDEGGGIDTPNRSDAMSPAGSVSSLVDGEKDKPSSHHSPRSGAVSPAGSTSSLPDSDKQISKTEQVTLSPKREVASSTSSSPKEKIQSVISSPLEVQKPCDATDDSTNTLASGLKNINISTGEDKSRTESNKSPLYTWNQSESGTTSSAYQTAESSLQLEEADISELVSEGVDSSESVSAEGAEASELNSSLQSSSESDLLGDSRTFWNKTEYDKRPLPDHVDIPAVGEYFDVHVVFTTDPGHFVCIPYEKMNDLEQMLVVMLEYFTPRPNLLLKDSDIKLGAIYAGIRDGVWYRVKVNQFVGKGLVSVFFVDLGDFSVMTLDELQPLPWRFWKLPMQAISASIHGIKPVGDSWAEAAKYEFIRQTRDKDLVSYIIKKNIDKRTGYAVASMLLIDTSGEEDVCIDELLVQKNLAQYVT